MHAFLRAAALLGALVTVAHAQVPLRPMAAEPIGGARSTAGHPPATPPLHRLLPKNIDCSAPTGDSLEHDGVRIFDQDSVSTAPELVAAGRREYPHREERHGIGGRVVLQFVIDTLGHADPCSFRTLVATSESFEGPAYRMVLESVYLPGRNDGKRVPVRITQSVTFNP